MSDPPHNLPSAVDSFVGREHDRRSVAGLLETSRLVTLVGSPGVGKTRLATEVALDAVPRFRDGVWLVALDPIVDPALIPQAVASSLGVREQVGASLIDTLIAEVRDKHLLLLLDNCEHLLAGCAELAGRLLRSCPRLSILATSRQPLGVGGERVRHVDPLGVPPPASDAPPGQDVAVHDAVRLFVARGAATRAGFVLTETTAPAVAEICRRLDGIPLAIELAAARLEMLSPQEILEHVDERFRFLTAGTPAWPGHQRSLFAALESSHRLLSPPEATLFRRLSVFVGGFSLPAATAVCAGPDVPPEAVMELLGGLVSKSLVSADIQRVDTRFRLLETVRDFAGRRLDEAGERASVAARHCQWCVELAEQNDVKLAVDTDPEAVNRVAGAQDNLRAGLEWALSVGDADAALRLAGALVLFWWLQGQLREGRRWMERALALDGEPSPDVRAKALWGAGFMTGSAGDAAQAVPLVEQALALSAGCEDATLHSRCRILLGLLCMLRCPADAIPLLIENLEFARGEDDPVLLSSALITLGTARLLVGDLRAARVVLEECLDVSRRAGNRSGTEGALSALGQLALLEGDYGAAQRLLDEALVIAEELGEGGEQSMVLSLSGDLARARGDYAGARADLARARELAGPGEPPFSLARCLCFLGRVGLAVGDLAEARSLFDESLSTCRRFGLTYLVARCLLGLGEVARVEGDSAAARAYLDEAVAVAEANGDRQAVAAGWHALADLARSRAPAERTLPLCHRALTLQSEIGDLPSLASTLETAAALFRPGAAGVRLFAAAQALRERGGYARAPVAVETYEADVAACRRALGDDEFRLAWKEGCALSVSEAVALASRGRGPRQRPATGWASLTPAEHDVASLAAQGLTNREIGERLFVSPRTAGAHLTQVFAKLGISSRRELTVPKPQLDRSVSPALMGRSGPGSPALRGSSGPGSPALGALSLANSERPDE
jgi:predicted ATPase/DNA-binding CsgD family transcriptional regulator